MFFNLKNKPKYNLLAFNNLCTAKYERLNLDWTLKHEPLMTKAEMEHFQKIAKSTGVKNPCWSGIVKKEEKSE